MCSTWIGINLGTSKRSLLVPGGDETSVATRKGNIMCARTRVKTIPKEVVDVYATVDDLFVFLKRPIAVVDL